MPELREPATTSETDASGKRINSTPTLPGDPPPAVAPLPPITGYTSKGMPVYQNSGPGSIGYHLNTLRQYPTLPREYQKKDAADYNAAVAWRDARTAAIAAINTYNTSMSNYNTAIGEKNKTLSEIYARQEEGRSIGLIGSAQGDGGIKGIKAIGGIKK